MNRQIVKLFGFIVVLFAVLVGFTSYWSVFDAKALKGKEANKRPLLEQQQIRRGRILAADGTVLARSVPKGHGDALRFVRRYPEGALFGHPIGYSFVRYGDSEFEQFHNDELVGEESEFGSILDQLTGRDQEGNDIVTNLDLPAQRVALEGLEAAGFGAVVAIEPSTGEVKVMASNKPYDPNRVPYELPKLIENKIETPLLNRATQGLYPPGSTFKVVTAAAGLESGTITPETTINAPGTLDRRRARTQQRLQPGLGLDQPRHRADQLGQHLVRAARPAGRPGRAVRNDGKVRLQLDAADRPAVRRRRKRGLQERRLRRRRTARQERSGRPGPGRDRPGAAAGDAAADRDGRRRGRQRRQADEAADLEPGGRPRRPRRQAPRPLRIQPSRSAPRPRQS